MNWVGIALLSFACSMIGGIVVSTYLHGLLLNQSEMVLAFMWGERNKERMKEHGKERVYH